MTITAALVCLLTTTLLYTLARVTSQRNVATGHIAVGWLLAGARFIVASFMTATLYILAIYATGYIGYLGPRNTIWLLGIPVLVALLEYPRPVGVLVGIPLAITGAVCTGVISFFVGISLD